MIAASCVALPSRPRPKHRELVEIQTVADRNNGFASFFLFFSFPSSAPEGDYQGNSCKYRLKYFSTPLYFQVVKVQWGVKSLNTRSRAMSNSM
jgi:hypothetical protein